MPPRLVCLALLLYWSAAVTGLITRDLLPQLSTANAPDFRALVPAGEGAGPTRWTVEVMDEPAFPESLRTIGDAITRSSRGPDGGVHLTSEVRFDAKGLLRNTPLAAKTDVKLGMAIASTYEVDPSGNLRTFHMGVKYDGDREGLDVLTVDGALKNRAIEITTRGPLPALNRTLTFPYTPRSLVQDALGPVDRLPGLHVGQRWETRIVSPLPGRADVVRARVTRRTIIHWDKNPVTVFEVVHHLTPLVARTWVRTDGLVLRQEVPFPFVRLILERQPDRISSARVGEGTGR
jgi:hypothetical protein